MIDSSPNTLIVMVKQPQLGRVKTRLARTIGAVTARQTYQYLMDQTIRKLRQDRRWQLILAISPDRARWRSWVDPQIRQGRGDLGQRMTRCLRALARPYAVLIGSDIPALNPEMVSQAFRTLKSCHFVFGPCDDGGYWLIGWRRSQWPPEALRRVRWSSEYALAESVSSLGSGCRVSILPTQLYDIDSWQDYQRWRSHEMAPGAENHCLW